MLDADELELLLCKYLCTLLKYMRIPSEGENLIGYTEKEMSVSVEMGPGPILGWVSLYSNLSFPFLGKKKYFSFKSTEVFCISKGLSFSAVAILPLCKNILNLNSNFDSSFFLLNTGQLKIAAFEMHHAEIPFSLCMSDSLHICMIVVIPSLRIVKFTG